MTDIILSLVRTKHVGYLRDIRRLTVALSRARLGLYILGRREVFEACPELEDAFKLLFQRPDKLRLVVGEMFPTERDVHSEVEDEGRFADMEGVEHLGQYVFEMTQAKVKALKEGQENPPEPEARVDLDHDEDDGPGEAAVADEEATEDGAEDGAEDAE